MSIIFSNFGLIGEQYQIHCNCALPKKENQKKEGQRKYYEKYI